MSREIAAKMRKLNALSDAILRLKSKKKRTQYEALQLQQLEQDRAELRALIPPLQLVK